MRVQLMLFVLAGVLPAQNGREAAARSAVERAIGQDPVDRPTTGTSDPLTPLIQQLELGYFGDQSGPAYQAYVALNSLGPAASPALYRALPKLGPFGTQSALRLLNQHPDERITTALTELLQSDDRARQLAAAAMLTEVPSDLARAPARLALQSDIMRVRIGGLAALARDGIPEEELVSAIEPFMATRDPGIRWSILDLIESRPLDETGLLPILVALAQDPVSDEMRERALREWAKRVGPDGEDRAIELFDRLTAGEAQSDLIDALWRAKRLPWTRFFLHVARGLTQPHGVVVQALLAAPPSDVPAEVIRHLLQIDPSLGPFGADALELALRTTDRALAPDIGALVVRADDVPSPLREQCFRWLQGADPDFLLDHAAELIQQQSVAETAATWFASLEDPRPVSAAAAFVHDIDYNHPAFSALADVVAYRSTPDNLGDVLDMVSLPLENSSLQGDRARAAQRALHRWFAAEHIPAALGRLFEIDYRVARTILERAAQIATPQQAAAVAELLTRCTTNWSEESAADGMVVDTATAGAGAVRILSHIRNQEAAAPLAALLVGEPTLPAELAYKALLTFPPPARDQALVRALTIEGDPWRALGAPEVASDPELRRYATELLLGGHAFHDEDVAAFLGRLPAEDRVALTEKLLATAASTGDEDRILVGLELLGELRRAEDLEEFARWLSHPSPPVRNKAIQQLGRTYSADAARHLLVAVNDEDEANRQLACMALDRFEQVLNRRRAWEERLRGKK